MKSTRTTRRAWLARGSIGAYPVSGRNAPENGARTGCSEEMRDHLLRLSENRNCPGWDCRFETTFKGLLESHLSRYKMASQTVTHSCCGRWKCEPTATSADLPSNCFDSS